MMISAMALVNRGEVAWLRTQDLQARRTFGFAGAIGRAKTVDAKESQSRGRETALTQNNLRNSFHQFPLGMTMSLARRRLIDFARAVQRLHFRGRSQLGISLYRSPTPMFNRAWIMWVVSSTQAR